jgi:Uma2 family endonuclease
MVAVEARLTVEQFLALPEIEGIKRELIDGEVYEVAAGGTRHETAKARGHAEFVVHARKHRLRALVCSETGFFLGEYINPQPDVAVVLSGDLDPTRTGRPSVVPDIVFEVAWSESVRDLQRKIKMYRRLGVRAVVIAYAESLAVEVYGERGFRHLELGESLELPDLLPGFSLPLADLFAGFD